MAEKKKKWAAHLKKRLKATEKGGKVCSPVPDDITNADVKAEVGDEGGKISRHGRVVCVVKV